MRVNFLNNVLIPGNFTRDELEQGFAYFAAQFMKYESLVAYIASSKANKKVIEDIKQALEKTGLYSGKHSNDEENSIFQAFDAGISARKKTVARIGGNGRHNLKFLKSN